MSEGSSGGLRDMLAAAGVQRAADVGAIDRAQTVRVAEVDLALAAGDRVFGDCRTPPAVVAENLFRVCLELLERKASFNRARDLLLHVFEQVELGDA